MIASAPGSPVLAVRNLNVRLRARERSDRPLHITRGVSLTAFAGRTLGVVGESGCGKSMMLRGLCGLLPRGGEATADEAAFDGQPLSVSALGNLRGRGLSMIFQDPERTLDPVWSVGSQLIEVLRFTRNLSKGEARRKAHELFERVGLTPAETRLRAYPHEFSGGMRQRVGIALAICSRPAVLLADEPTTALDVTTQREILLLLKELQADTRMAIIFVTHDLGVIRAFCDTMVVMYAGSIVERGSVATTLSNPSHPYTRALVASQPQIDAIVLPNPILGAPPEFAAMPAGCPFRPRCSIAVADCARIDIATESQRACACPRHMLVGADTPRGAPPEQAAV